MKFHLKLPGVELTFEKDPMDPSKFHAVCRLVAGWLYVSLTRVIVSTGDFFAILWFFALTVAITGMWLLREFM